MRTDVLVIGGGATGAGIARDLVLRGVDVTLVDRGGLSTGTSGRSHGLLHSGARYAESDAAGARECIAENQILREIAGECIRDTGGLFVVTGDDDPEYADRKIAACRALDIPVEELDAEAAQNAVPGLTDDLDRAFRVPDGVVYPSRLVAANAADARDHGARILTDAPVTDIQVDDGAIETVDVGGDVGTRIEPTYVVNATGAWAGKLAALAGVDVPMRPTRGVMVAVPYEGLGPVLNRCRPPADGDIVLPHATQVVLGTTSVAVDDPDEYDQPTAELQRAVRECATMLPSVADLPHDRVWWGVRPLYAPDEDARGTRDDGVGEGRGISRGFHVLDHDDQGVDNFCSVVGGKLTTYRRMAEAATDAVCAVLGVDDSCRTADVGLPGRDDADRLDQFVSEFGALTPSDADVVGVDRL
jgi:glycerol-3-phosphate dehydrogenase